MTFTARRLRSPVIVAALAGGLGLAMPVVAVAGVDDGGPTQVSVVPADGSAAGGGPPPGRGTDSALLIGVGIAAVTGSIGLFAAAQAAARRN